jgi:RNA polymerase sigma-70 factor, ECF subfamily
MQLVFSRKTIFGVLAFAIGRAVLPLRLEDKRINAAKTRDSDAFAELMDAHAEPLRRFIARRVRPDDREDVFQDTWLAVWQSLPTFDARSNFRAWMYSICFHKIQDHWRKEQYRPPSADLADAEGRLAYLPSEYASIELQAAMTGFWEACTPDQRELLRMYYSDGLTLKEIGIILNKNLNTVKYQFYRVHELAVERLPESPELLLRRPSA